MLSWISFLLPRDQSPARVTLGVTSVLTVVTIFTMSNQAMPRVCLVYNVVWHKMWKCKIMSFLCCMNFTLLCKNIFLNFLSCKIFLLAFALREFLFACFCVARFLYACFWVAGNSFCLLLLCANVLLPAFAMRKFTFICFCLRKFFFVFFALSEYICGCFFLARIQFWLLLPCPNLFLFAFTLRKLIFVYFYLAQIYFCLLLPCENLLL